MAANRQEEPGRRRKAWSTLTKQIVIIGALIAVVWAVFKFSSILSPLILAVMLAYLLVPVVNWLWRKTHMPRLLAVIIVFILLLLILTLTPALIIPNLISQFTALNVDLQAVLTNIETFISRPVIILGYSIQPVNYTNQIIAAVQSLASPVTSGAVGVVIGLANSVFWLIFVLLVAFYLVKDSAQIARYLRGLIPPDYRDEMLRLVAQIGVVWDAFFRSQIIMGIVVGASVAVIMTILGVRNALMLGLLAGILEMIPYFGPVIAAIPAVLLAFFWGSSIFVHISNLWFTVIVTAAYLIVQQVENNILYPRIMGQSMKLHPAVVLAGAVAGWVLAGVLGALLAAPVLAMLRILIRYAYCKVMDEDPFAEAAPAGARAAVMERGVIGGRPIAAVLFDLDGALLVPDDEAIERLAQYLRWVRPLLPDQDPKRSLRRTILASERPASALSSVMSRVGLDQQAEALAGHLRRLRGERTPPSQPPAPAVDAPADSPWMVKGARELLGSLSGKLRLGLLTRRERAETTTLLNYLGLQDYFGVVITKDETDGAPLSEAAIRLAAEKLEVPAEHCAVVADTPDELRAAQAAGAAFVGVLCGLGDRQSLADADLLIESTADLAAWL